MTAQKVEFAKFKKTPIILISGGASSLAYFVTRLLLSAYKQIKIISVDNLETGSEENIKDFRKDPRYTFINFDLNKGVPEGISPADCILHLAAAQDHPEGEDKVTLDSLLTNAFATKNLLELALSDNSRFLLISSINVYQGILSSLDLKNYFGPTSQIEKRFSHIEAKRYAEALCWEYYKRYDLDLRIVRLGELYGPKIPLFGYLGGILQQVIEDGLITVTGDGLEKENFVYVEDAADAIARALLVKNTKGKIFPIAYDKPFSVIEIAYLVKSVISKEVKILFSKAPSALEIPLVKNIARDNLEIISWKPKVDLEEGIRKTLDFYNFLGVKGEQLFTLKLGDSREPSLSKPTLSSLIKKDTASVPKQATRRKRNLPSLKNLSPRSVFLRKPSFLNKRALVLSFVAVLSLLILPTIFYLANIYFSLSNSRKASNFLQSYDISRAEKYARSAKNHYLLAQRPPLLLNISSSLLGKTSFLDSTKHLSRAVFYSSEAILSFSEVMPSLDTAEDTQSELLKTEDLLMLSKAEYSNVTPSFAFFSIKVADLSYSANDSLMLISQLKAVSPYLPRILGLEKQMTYLLLIQNSTEITPSGGVVSSVAKIILENGEIKDIVVEDLSSFNASLTKDSSLIALPPELSGYLSSSQGVEKAFYVPDFPKAAEAMRTVYENTFNEEIDGIFAVDLDFVKQLLSFTGPIFLSYYDISVDENNIYEKAQFYTEYGESQISQNKNFMSNVIYKISDTFFTSKDSFSSYAFLDALDKSLNEKHLLAYFKDPSVRNAFYELNWCGDLALYNGDYFYALDTNVGATRSNIDVQKEVNYFMQKNSEGFYTAHAEIIFTHKGKSNAWPGGVYKDLLRLYVPKGSSLVKASYTNKVEVDVTKDIKTFIYESFTSFPLLIQVGAGETAKVDIYYTLPEIDYYTLMVQKQPGTTRTPFHFMLTDPEGGLILKKDLSLERDTRIDISSD